MARLSPPRKVTHSSGAAAPPAQHGDPVAFEVGRRFRCTLRVDCGELDPDAVIRPVGGEWHPHIPERLDDEELADWCAGRMRSISSPPDHRRAPRGRRRVRGDFPPSALSAARGAMTRPRADRRSAPSFGRGVSAFAPKFLHAGPDRWKSSAARGRMHSRRSSSMRARMVGKSLVVRGRVTCSSDFR